MFNRDKGEETLIKEPGTFIRYGTGVVFSFFLLGLFLASGISFNEVIKGEVVITTMNPSAEISANNTGEIISINFRKGDTVSEGSVLAVLKNSANEADVAFLKQNLQEGFPIPTSVDSLETHFPMTLNLGSLIQPYYKEFLDAYITGILANELKEDVTSQEQKKILLIAQKNLVKNKSEQLIEAKQNLVMRQTNFERNERLYNKGVISKMDLEKVSIEYKEEKERNLFLEQQQEELIIELKHIKNSLHNTITAGEKNESFQKASLTLAKQELFSQILEWEDKFTLKSPIEGRLVFHDVWAKHQTISEGDVVFSVVPTENSSIIGKCVIPVHNSGKVVTGQEVILKLENYPYKEWGTLKGTVESISISEIGKSKGYTVYLQIDDLRTSYGKELELNQQLIGTAEIILEKVSLSERIFYQFRYLWSN